MNHRCTAAGVFFAFFLAGGTVLAQDQVAELIVSSLTTNMKLGASVDIHGDYAVIGGPGQDGTQCQTPGEAYIFHREGSNWVQQARLQASDAAVRDRFGSAVAVWDPYAVVVAGETGKVYVFERTGTNWAETQSITPIGGCSVVDIYGQTFAVGSPEANAGTSACGAVYIYEYVVSSNSWLQSARVTADTPRWNGHLGNAVSLEGTNLLVGAWGTSFLGQRPGAAYYFEKSGTNWVQQHIFSITDTYAFIEYFGWDVALHGDQALIAGSASDVGGLCFLYSHSGTNWTEELEIDDPIHTSFGRQVALGSDWMAGMAFGGAPSSAIMLYGNNPVAPQRWIRYSDLRSPSGYWGYYEDMAIDGWELIVGRFDTRSYTNNGALIYTVNPDNRQYRMDGTNDYAHHGESGGGTVAAGRGYTAMGVLPSTQTSAVVAVYAPTGQHWVVDALLSKYDPVDPERYMNLGAALDMDGVTVVAGCPINVSGNYDRVLAFWRDTNVWYEQAEWTLSASQGFGTAVAVAGDFAALGVPGADQPTFDEGAVLVQKRTGTNWAYYATLTQIPAQFGDQFGYSVDMTTNFLIGGAPFADTLKGKAWIFCNVTGTWTQAAALTEGDLSSGDNYGKAVAISDTHAAVGAPGVSTGGVVYLYYFDGTNWTRIAKLSAPEPHAGDEYGAAVALNHNRLLVGASDEGVATGSRNPGRAYLYKLDGTNVEEAVNVWPGDPSDEYEYGRHVALSDDYGMVGPGSVAESYILYLPPDECRIAAIGRTGDVVQLDCTNLTCGALYSVEYTASPTSDWTSAGHFVAQSVSSNWNGSVPGWDVVLYRLHNPCCGQ